ncbi:MAG: hypothetical protein AAF281_12960 [Pseudomonadota bacterium]
MLRASDRAIAAEIIAEPDVFLDYQRSSRPSRRAFVDRYRAWGAETERVCAA